MRTGINAKEPCWHRIIWGLAIALLLGGTPVYPSQAPTREYQLEKQVFPDNVVEIRAVRNLQSTHFPSDLEVEVKNISGKPLYHVYFVLRFKNSIAGVPLEYGNSHLVDLANLPSKEDRPIEPGANQILRVPRSIGLGTETAIAEGRLPLEATLNFTLIFQTANFGDGSGYILKDYRPAKQ